MSLCEGIGPLYREGGSSESRSRGKTTSCAIKARPAWAQLFRHSYI
jgi:hypothetical protein